MMQEYLTVPTLVAFVIGVFVQSKWDVKAKFLGFFK